MSELETVVNEVETKVETVVGAIEQEAKKELAQLSADEKLFLRETELEYLKATMEIQRLNKITEAKSKEYQNFIESLYKKYGLDKVSYVFDGAVNEFRAIEKKL